MWQEQSRRVVGSYGVWTNRSVSQPHLRLRESVAVDTRLLLVLGLIAPLEVALLKTPVNADGQVVRDLE